MISFPALIDALIDNKRNIIGIITDGDLRRHMNENIINKIIENKTSKFKTIEDLIKTKSIISKVPCLIYVDAAIVEQHSIENLLEICHRDSMILVDSIRETQSQFKYWNQLKSASEISVSIDTFYWGLLFLRTAQPKEHFTIRL